jgi:glycosyltransferase involved in cell wall biosynthesis
MKNSQIPKSPKISVIIPVYNGEKTLKPCLDSVLNQTYKDYEVIVIDNDSTDKTKEIIMNFQKKNKKLIYLFEPVIGIGAARNTGEKKAKGDIILMTDSDCIVPKNWIGEMIKAIKGHDAIQGFQKSISDIYWSRYKQINSEEKYKNEKMRNPIGKIDTKNFGIKKNVLEKIGFTSRIYYANDTYLSIKLAKNCNKVGFKKAIRVKHYHADSLSRVFKRKIKYGKSTAIITKNNIYMLKKTDFLKDTCQTTWSFFKFFPGIFRTMLKKGFKYAYYDLIVGLSWRIGLIMGWLTKNA